MIAGENNVGDPDTWPEAIVWLALIVGVCFVVWCIFKYGWPD